MRLLVTGGAGFIGSHLCEKLLDLGHNIVCIDNFNDAYCPQIKRDNLNNCLNSTAFSLQEGDIRDNDFLEKAFSLHDYDQVIHLAAMAGVRPSIKYPALYYEVNVTGTLNILEKCRQHGIERFIFASSSSVYGNNPKIPFEESDKVDAPISLYAASKRAGELLCHTYHHLFNISTLCLRFFTVYGPRQRPDLAIHKFASKILTGKPIQVYGDENSSRDYTYVDDIISGVVKAIDYVKNGNHYEVFNLGESKTITLSTMIKTLEKLLDKKAVLENLPQQEGDVLITYASIEKSKNELGYSPKTDFEEGVRMFVEWLLKQKQAPNE